MTVYSGYLPSGAVLNEDLWIVSPSGTYFALQQDDGNFVVVRGTDPSLPGKGVFQTGTYTSGFGDVYYSTATGHGSWALYEYLPAEPSVTTELVRQSSSSGGSGNYYASLSDNGNFQIINGLAPGNNGTGNGAVSYQTGANDPVTSIDISAVTYDLADTTYTSSSTIHSALVYDNNTTASAEVYPNSESLSYKGPWGVPLAKTNTFNWSLSEALALSVKSTEKIGVPGLDVTLEESVTETTTLAAGQSVTTTEQDTFSAGGTTTVPPFTEYATFISGQQVDAQVPYTYTGIATYASGNTAYVDGTGYFVGSDTNAFTVTTECITAPGGCPLGPGSPSRFPNRQPRCSMPLEPSAQFTFRVGVLGGGRGAHNTGVTSICRCRRRLNPPQARQDHFSAAHRRAFRRPQPLPRASPPRSRPSPAIVFDLSCIVFLLSE